MPIKQEGFLTKRKVPLFLLNQYAEDRGVLDDMDLANIISNLIGEMISRRIKPVLDFENITKIHPYWIVLALIKWTLKANVNANKIVGICNVTSNQLKLINIVNKEILKNGSAILNGITTSVLPDDDND